MVYKYILTIAKRQRLDYVSNDDLKIMYCIFSRRYPKAKTTLIGVEAHGLYRQLHMHGLLHSSRMLHFTKESLDLGYGFYAHLQYIKNPTNLEMNDIIDYITKYDTDGCYERDLILAQNYCSYFNAFGTTSTIA